MSKKKTETVGLMPNGNIVRYDTTETPGLPEKPKRKPRVKKPIEPAPTTTQPAEPLTDPLEEAIKQLTPEQIEIGNRQAEAGELFEKLCKTMKPRAARREVLRRLNVRITPDNSQPYVKPKETPQLPEISEAERLGALNKTMEVIKSGFAGISQGGEIVDRRENPDAIPIPENSLFNTPAPKEINDGSE